MPQCNNVRPPVKRLTDTDARHLLAEGLIRACHVHGPSRVALEIGCDEKTVRRARDEDSTLGLACHWNLLDVDPSALNEIAAAKGVKLVHLDAGEGNDRSAASALTRLLLEMSLALEDGKIDDSELSAMRTALESAGQHIDRMRERLALRSVA
jgi:hypothetical protein